MVRRVKKKIKPWRVKGWEILPIENSDFTSHMELVFDIYKPLYDEEFPVVCIDDPPTTNKTKLAFPLPKTGRGCKRAL